MKKATRLLFVLSLSQSLLPQTWAQNATAIAATQLPSGGKVVGGQATLQSSGSTLNVNQTSQRGVVEWDTFNVGSKAKINFNQPSPSSVTLNRVMDMNASQILGRISATGQVFISNPNGIIFGTTAQVDVAGIVATTKSISNTDFLNGKTTFEGDGRTSSVINQGSLQAALGGYIALLAPHVRNEGIIVAREGTVALAAGDKTTLEFSGNKLVAVIVDRPVMDALVENKQLVRAEGGYVVLSARSANALLSSVIKQSGTIEAPSLVQREGRILLEGGEKGVVSTGGTLSVAGMQEGTVGGRIVATGDKVLVTQDAKLDATGQSGGGKINIGGGWQGKDSTIRQANAVQVEAGARLDASAIQTGNGGEIVVWSDTQKTDGMTRVAGDLKARGGAEQGDGGRIETSGHWLSTEGATGDASAKRGAAGQWLFDPYDITITSSATQGNAESSGTWTPSATGSNILNTSINSLLDAGTNVTISTGNTGTEAGYITVNADITQSATAPAARLTLNANQDITINNAISMTKSGSKLELNAGNSSNGGNVTLAGTVNADTVSMNLTGAGSVTQTTALSTNNLRIAGTGTQVTLADTSNNIGVIAANVASINLKTQEGIDLGSIYGKGLSVDTVEGMSGVTATGNINLASRTGNIFVKQNISTSSTSNSAIQLNAGEAASVGANTGPDSAVNPYGANIVLTPSKTITTGSGGRATLFAGSGSGSGADLSAYVGAGSGRFRYNSDESTTNYTTPLSSGLFAIYRQNPNLTVSANNTTMVYGASVTPSTSSTVSGYLNGDTQGQSVSSAASVSIGGGRSSAGYLIAGDHALTASGAQSALGYGFAYSGGTLTVSKKSLTISTTASNKIYDATTAATTALTSDKFQLDDVTLNNTSSTFANKNAGTGKTVTVAGLSISGADADNYNLTNTSASATANITQKTLAATYTAANKIYDGTTNAVVTGSSSDIISGDTVTFSKTASTFSDKNVGNAKTVTVSGIQISGTDASNYLLTNTSTTNTADITQKSLTAVFSASNKVYDGDNTATVIASSAQLVNLDAVTISNTGASFDNKNVGTGKTVSISGVAISGADANNYSLSNAAATTTANITKKDLSISGITASNKIYDGTTSATIDATNAIKTGLVVNDTVNVSATGVFNNKNVGNAKTVTLTSSYSGLDAGNYNITNQTATTANVTPRTLAVTAVANDKTYDTTRTATYSLSSDQVVGDTLTLAASSALFDTKHAGVGKSVTVAGIAVTGADAGNYTLQNGSTTTAATVNKADLNITGITANNKTYDGDVTTTLSGTAAIAPLQADVVSLGGAPAPSFADKHVGTGKTVTTTGYTISGADANNYNLITPTLTANITKKAISLTGITAADKTYDGTNAATVSTANAVFNNQVANDDLTVTSTGTFSDKNAATSKTVTLANTLGGTDLNNYTVTNQTTTTASITKKDVSLTSISAANKTYDGTATASISSGVIAGTIGSEALLISGTGTFSDKNAANGKIVTVADVTQLTKTSSTGDWSNYNLTTSGALTTQADITPKAITLSGITAAAKTYDGTTAATVSTANAVFNNQIVNDNLTVASSGTFSDKNAATGKTVTLANTLGGTDLSNYTVTDQTSTTADITPKAITLSGITAAAKTYDGTTAATVSTANAVFNNQIVNDNLTVASSGTFSDKNAATGKTVTLANTLGGTDLGNYTVTNQASTTADITPKAITLSGITAAAKTYDGTTAATVSTANAVFNNQIVNDNLTVASSGTFSDKNAATGKTVTLANTLGGTDLANYTVTDQTSTTADITPKAITLSGITAAAKTYDGTTAATVSTANAVFNNQIVNDNLTVASSGTFSDKNAATGKTVTLANTLGGTDLANYTVTDQTSTTADITPKAITLSGITAAAKTYDGTTAATVSTANAVFNNQIVNDNLTVASSGTFSDKNAANGKTVSLANTLGGSDLANYTVTDQTSTTANITPKAITLSGITAAAKTYDGTTVATVSTTNAVFNNQIVNDNLTVASSGTFSDKNAATGKTVSLANTLGGSDLGNYTITDQTSTTADITPKAITLSGITAAAKTYDGTTAATVSTTNAVFNNQIVNDNLTVASSGTFSDKNAAIGKTVILNNTLGGTDLANYTVTNQATTKADINKKDVFLSGINAESKLYDASAKAQISSGTITGTVGSESLQVSGVGAFESINAGSGKTVTVSDAAQLTKTNGTGDWSNYNLTNKGEVKTTGTIIPLSDNCTRANASGCITSETSSTPKIIISADTQQKLASRVDPQLMKQSAPESNSGQAPASVTAPASVFLTAPITSTTRNVNALTPIQISEMPPAQLAPLIKSLDAKQLLAITENQMRGLNASQLDELIGLLNRAANNRK
jgi:filamentous hemagglutinin family protein